MPVFSDHFAMLKAIPAVVLTTIYLSVFNHVLEAAPLDELSVETINIKADQALEEEESGAFQFSGDFSMHSSDWELMSDKATFFGKLDKPDQVSLQGTPAKFRILQAEGVDRKTIEATAPSVEYLRSSNSLKLTGGAVLKLDDEIIRSQSIQYDIDANRYRADGSNGVTIEVPTLNKREK